MELSITIFKYGIKYGIIGYGIKPGIKQYCIYDIWLYVSQK